MKIQSVSLLVEAYVLILAYIFGMCFIVSRIKSKQTISFLKFYKTEHYYYKITFKIILVIFM